MSFWKSFNVPDSLIGEKHASESTYVTTYQTEVLLPKDSPYAGYYFLHPSKLISEKAGGFTAITFNPDFTFTLIKKDREPGKRYKRYKLTVPEILKIYEGEITKIEAKLEKKEQRRLSQVGSVEIVYTENQLWGDKTLFLFHVGKQYSYGSGEPFGSEKHVDKWKVIIESVQRSVFETAYEQLVALWEEYWMIQEVRCAVSRCNTHTTEKVCAIGDSFEALCDQWEAEFMEKARAILRRNNHE